MYKHYLGSEHLCILVTMGSLGIVPRGYQGMTCDPRKQAKLTPPFNKLASLSLLHTTKQSKGPSSSCPSDEIELCLQRVWMSESITSAQISATPLGLGDFISICKQVMDEACLPDAIRFFCNTGYDFSIENNSC